MQTEENDLHGAKDIFLITAVCVTVGLVIAFTLGYLEPSMLYSASLWFWDR